MSAYLLAMTSNNAPDPLDPARDAVLEEALADAPFDGWTGLMLRAAAARRAAKRAAMEGEDSEPEPAEPETLPRPKARRLQAADRALTAYLGP